MQRVKLSHLIEAGVFKPPLTIYASFKGHNFSAVIEPDGFVLMDGRRFTSLSLAAGHIRAMITGPASDGLPYRRANGWSFWHYKDKKGELQSMAQLR